MKKILMIPGDGIGPEVMRCAKSLLLALYEKYSLPFLIEEVDWGAERWLRDGIGLPDGILPEIAKKFDAILFGALGDPRIPDMAHGREILLGLRFGLDLFINMRPVKLLVPSLGILKNDHVFDMVIFRENTEDIYLGLGESKHRGTSQEVAIDISRHSYKGVRRIIEAAFSFAREHGRKRVTLVDKSNAIKFGGELWQRLFKEIAANNNDIAADHLFVDVAAMHMVQNPARFDVIVTSNLFGDILSDLGAGIAGGLGITASGNINPSVIGLFEPVHGSAPDIAGKNLANPFAMFLSTAMMLRYLGYDDIARLIDESVIACIRHGHTTADLGGALSTEEAASSVINTCMNR